MRRRSDGASERELERVLRLYDARRSVNHAIVRARDRDELLQAVCSLLVEEGRFATAFIAWLDAETPQLAPAARAGEQARIEDGDRAHAALPIRERGAVRGTLNVYASEGRTFDAREVALLDDVAADLSFALDNLAKEAARAQAGAIAEGERQFSAAMIESMPGIVYFYDERGRFLRWNRNFETVSGYSGSEIASMHPLDFFVGAERELLRARIGDVLAHGEASVEASFVSKDGTSTPYYFTGRRVVSDGVTCLVGMGIDISDKKRSERALQASEERFRTTVDSIVEGCQLIAFDWTYLYLNDTASKHNRRPNAELLGRTMLECWPGIEQTEVFAMLRRCMVDRIALHEEVLFTFADGSTNWFDIRSQPVLEGIFVLSIDISERKRGEAEIEQANSSLERKVVERTAALDEAMRLLDAIIDHLPNAVFYKDADLRFLGANLAYEQAFGVRRADLVGKTVLELGFLPEEDRRRFQQEQLELLATGVSIRREATMPFADQRAHPTLYSVKAMYRADGSKAGVVGAIVDITALKESEAALARAMRAAEAADRLKSAFLATMSHELRTPLNSIIGFTGILIQGLAGPLNAEQTKQLGMVRGSARHLLELINDVLDISKIEAGQMTTRREVFELAPLLERALGVVKPLADRKQLELRLQSPTTLPPLVSDARRVEQILINLLSNAVKFTERGTVTLEAECVGDSLVRFRVKDTGEGILPQDQEKLFQPFTQIDTGLTRKHEGTGLGLAICKRLATMLGGEIECASTFGKGSTFTVTLPIESRSS